ncbi:MAG: ABC transporter permease [Chlamydiae bacterium]|nr:ABC transporter permease [Chlamydiota bacterium]
MNLLRIKAMYLRYLYNIFRLDQFAELFFWPILDIFLWGITMVWIQQIGGSGCFALQVLTALVFWQIAWRSNYEVSVNILQELWARNFVNLFSTPLKPIEWMTSLMLLGLTKNFITILFGSGIIFLLYSLNILAMGWPFFLYSISLIISGWWCGFLSSAVIVYFGQRMQMLAWIAGYIFSPLCAVFYPLSALPDWIRPISKSLPMTYVFEGMRNYLDTGIFRWDYFYSAMGLNLVYFLGTVFLFLFFLEKSREKGLSRLE